VNTCISRIIYLLATANTNVEIFTLAEYKE